MMRAMRTPITVLQLALLISIQCILYSIPTLAQSAAQNRLLKSEAVVPMKTHSIYAPYVESDLQNKFWDFGGDAIVDTNRAILLTQDRPSQSGWLWSRLPLSAENFEIVGEFKVDGSATGHHPYGDGFAMWLTEERAQVGPVYGSKDYFTGLAIIFDTFANARHPYTFPRIMGVNLNGVEKFHFEKDGATQEKVGCSIDIRRAKIATKFRFTYVQDVFSELAIHYDEWDSWEICFKTGNLTIPHNPFLGFSAATGDVSDNHEIISVASSQILYHKRSPKELAEERLYHLGDPKKSRRKDKGKSWFGKSKSAATTDSGGHTYNGNAGGGVIKGFFSFVWTLIKWGAAVALVGAGAYAYYTRKKKYDAKRF